LVTKLNEDLLMPNKRKLKKIVLIDCNKAFRKMMNLFAESRGIQLECFESVLIMGSICKFGDFDVAIVESETGTLSGIEVGEYLSSLFNKMPLILISSGLMPNQATRKGWPLSVRGYIHKNDGADAILDRALFECA